MEVFGLEFFAIVGFILAAYAVIANDSIQTLGTFLSSNAQRPWWVLWIFASGILLAALAYAYFYGQGDVAFGRLNQLPYPEGGIQWWHALPPLALLFLTRLGIPVSTTFLVLTVFALSGGAETEGVMTKMLIKSALGYVVAFGAGAIVYLLIARLWERWIGETKDQTQGTLWTVFQWFTTGFLWWQWLTQDFANIFIFLPRERTEINGEILLTFAPGVIIFAALVMVAMQAYIMYTRGGEIQKIVLAKVHTTDVRAATIVDLIYALILWYFKGISDIPMSTTWVFLGLLAGRELAISWVTSLRTRRGAIMDVSGDMGRAFIGLVISVVLAVGVPWLATGQMPQF